MPNALELPNQNTSIVARHLYYSCHRFFVWSEFSSSVKCFVVVVVLVSSSSGTWVAYGCLLWARTINSMQIQIFWHNNNKSYGSINYVKQICAERGPQQPHQLVQQLCVRHFFLVVVAVQSQMNARSLFASKRFRSVIFFPIATRLNSEQDRDKNG